MGEVKKEKWFQVFKANYLRAERCRKKELISELVSVLGIHRKSAIRLLRKESRGRKPAAQKRGPKSRYQGEDFVKALRLVWRETEQMCSKLLVGARAEWIYSVERHYGVFPEPVRTQLFRISAASMDRVLRPYKVLSRGGTKPGSMLRNQIPIQGSIWDEQRPGFVEADTVAHCGNSLEGQFVWSLTLTDIYSQWTECRAVWHKAAEGVVAQVVDIEKRLPFALRGFDCDNGSEFLNNYLVAYFSEKKKKIIDFTFTRSRPYHKNDNAHVEQRNWSHPRRLFGRLRLDEWELVDAMNDLYANEFSLLRNHFFPTLKLEQKVMLKSRYRRLYGDPVTPYQRVMASPFVADDIKQALKERHESLDPIELKRAVQEKSKRVLLLLRLATQRTDAA